MDIWIDGWMDIWMYGCTENVDYITQYIIEHDIDLLTITETWLTDTDQYIINDITFNSAIYI